MFTKGEASKVTHYDMTQRCKLASSLSKKKKKKRKVKRKYTGENGVGPLTATALSFALSDIKKSKKKE